MKSLFTILILVLMGTLNLQAQRKADDIVGIWKTSGEKTAHVQVYKTAKNTYEGKIVWLKFPTENGAEKVDKNNPDKNLRKQKLNGLTLLKGFRFDGSDVWEDGTIYDPESGKTYSCVISLKNDNILKVRGYVGISLLGRTEQWNRVNK